MKSTRKELTNLEQSLFNHYRLLDESFSRTFIIPSDKCKTGCDGPSGPIKFTPGTTYKYDYDGKINILVSTAEGEQTTTEIKATVLLTQQADCSQVLRLQNVEIYGPDGKVPNIQS